MISSTCPSCESRIMLHLPYLNRTVVPDERRSALTCSEAVTDPVALAGS